MDYMYAVNVLFCVAIVVLGFNRYRNTSARAFLFIAFAYLLFGFSHFALGMGWGFLKPMLTAMRTLGYVLMVLGMLL